ncbi:hypothetical protein ACH4VR_29050 [Streptomyces sp. NPDC020883]|uniref:hypothetical protein n=1 Tax=Streptomyces sp. NPDC020883 TaxID=3365099 RepID=UPI0037A46B4B
MLVVIACFSPGGDSFCGHSRDLGIAVTGMSVDRTPAIALEVTCLHGTKHRAVLPGIYRDIVEVVREAPGPVPGEQIGMLGQCLRIADAHAVGTVSGWLDQC